jgi:flagellar hook-length control protein FliK
VSAGAGQSGTDGQGQQPGQPQSQPGMAPVQPAQQARAAAAYGQPSTQQQPAAATANAAPATAVTATAATSAPANAAPTAMPTATPVPLARAAEAVEHVLLLASARGVTHARIALRPAELGAVDVHLRSTAEGIVARLVAHSPAAAQTLQQSAADLRRSLESQGLTLLNLDIGQSGERSAGRAGADASGLAGGQPDTGSGSDAAGDEDTSIETTSLRLPNGVLVDVLA